MEMFGATEEQAVGISQFIRGGSQLLGIQKYLISDFIVNEIDTEGNVMLLKSKPDLNKKVEEPAKIQEVVSYKIDGQLEKEIIFVLGQEAYEKIKSLYERLDIGEKVQEWKCQAKSPESKEQRTAVHTFIRQKLTNIDSRTENGQIVMMYSKSIKKMRRNHDFLHFKLFKSNIDTMSALFKLSKIIGVNQKQFGVAGLKDKRGITTQKISLFNGQQTAFNRFFKVAGKTRQLWVDDFQSKNEQVALGQLQGNRFSIILRFVRPRHEVEPQLLENLKTLKQLGFINYFGMQRFGRGDTKTHHIGVQVLKKNWKAVIDTLVLQDLYDNQINNLKKQYYEQGEYKKAEKILSNKHAIQKNIFFGLTKYGPNYCNVFESLPRNTRMLYGHSLQSFIWNKITSRRIRQHGLQVKVGDLVALKQLQQQKQEEQEIFDEDYEVGMVTNETLSQYSIYDVVSPMIGSTTNISQQWLVHKYILEELDQLGLSLENFGKGLPKSLMLPGGYRKVVTKLESVQWEMIDYSSQKEQLQNGFYYMPGERKQTKGDLFAVRLQFDLRKSSYATMLMREVLKLSSSFDVQQKLNSMFDGNKKMEQKEEQGGQEEAPRQFSH